MMTYEQSIATPKQVGMLSHLCKRYVDKLPDQMQGKANMKYFAFERFIAGQDRGLVSGLIETLLDEAVPDEVKQNHFNLFLTGQ